MNGLKGYAKGIVSTVMTRLLGDQDGLIELAIRKGPAKGLRFRLNLQYPALEHSYWFGKYDRPVLETIASLCQPGWTVWDCGTYLGYYTSFFARLVGPTGKVVAFEPDPTNMERTKRNAALNGFSNISFEAAAVGGPSGEVDLVLSRNTNSHLPGVYVGASREDYKEIERVDSRLRIRCTSLDDACFMNQLPRPNLIKLDIEGAEMIAVQFADRICKEVRPLFVLELHNPECDRAIWEWSQRVNYSLKSIDTGRPLTRPEDVGGTLLCSPPHKA